MHFKCLISQKILSVKLRCHTKQDLQVLFPVMLENPLNSYSSISFHLRHTHLISLCMKVYRRVCVSVCVLTTRNWIVFLAVRAKK